MQKHELYFLKMPLKIWVEIPKDFSAKTDFTQDPPYTPTAAVVFWPLSHFSTDKKKVSNWSGHLSPKVFETSPIYSPPLFSHGKNPENHEIFEKWAYFSRKILKNGYPFLPKSPLKMGTGFEARAAHPCPTQIWVPPTRVSNLGLVNFAQI